MFEKIGRGRPVKALCDKELSREMVLAISVRGKMEVEARKGI